jgi:ketosteroid isomerase-like protein
VTRRGDVGRGKDLWNQFETRLVKHDLEGLLSVFAIDAVYSAPNFRNEGRAAIGAFFDAVVKAFSNPQVDTSLVVEEGDTVVAEWTQWTHRDTQTGVFVMLDGTETPASGSSLEIPAVTVAHVRDGKFVTTREYFDLSIVISQLTG